MAELLPLLDISRISRHYHSGEQVVRALDDVSLKVWEGEFIAIMGQSGSGKSTLMNLIGCLDKPSSGHYRILGKEVSGLDADELAALRRDTFGFIFQRYNLIATASAEENVEMPAIYAGMTKHHRVERAREMLAKLGMGGRVDHRPSQLSGGQQQRVAVARALMNNPPIILADEPTGALDSRSGEEVMELLKQLHQEGRTIILITHDEKVAQHAERIIRLQDGKIISEDGEEKPKPAIKRNLGREAGASMGEVSEAVKMAVRSLKVNMFRTFLTLLGIVIGVAAVIIMLAIGDGSKEKLLAEITKMGTNLLHVRPGAPGVRAMDVITLTQADAEALGRLDNIVAVVPERSGRVTLRFGNRDHIATVDGTGHLMPDARGWPVEEGNFFTKKDVDGYAPVALIGKTVQQNLFPEGMNPIGRYILVKNVPFEIIGIMSSKGDTGWGGDQDDKVFVPYTTGIVRLFGRPYLSSVTLKVAEMSQIDSTEKAVHALMMSRHKVEDFSVRNSASFIQMATNAQDTISFLLAAVALISLVVGGIGVMNIMLVSVTERTREIGIRMATGARFRDIMVQFNTEAVFVCTIGGMVGVMLGFAGGWALKVTEVAAISFSLMPALVAFLSAVLTGVLFGFLPARKAARMDPVVALAAE